MANERSAADQNPARRGPQAVTDAEAADVTGGATTTLTGSSGTPINKPILKPITPRFMEPCV